MQRFILVDHSIMGLAGHHYEYAVHVLRAAEKAGYDPVLVTNRKFCEKTPWQVLPLYEFGFWPEPVLPWYVKLGVKLFASLTSHSFRLRFNLRYSELGLAWATRHNWLKYLKPREPGQAHLVVRFAAVVLIVMSQTARILGAAIVLPLLGLLVFPWWAIFSVARFMFWAARALYRGETPVIRQPVRSFFKGLAGAVRKLIQLRLSARQWLGRKASSPSTSKVAQQSEAFGRDSGRMLRLLTPSVGDILFFPTISEHDLNGLTGYLNRTRQGLEASWHFLFRRNIYAGAKADYATQDPGLEDMRIVFERVQQSVLADRSFFYTDTEELTEQYDRLGIFRFHTLPVPHTYQLSDRIRHGGPLRLTYLGDARTEKGFPLLPELTESLENEYLVNGKVRLALQCNYNIPGGEPRVAVARDYLESMAAEYLELHKKPLTSDEYRQLLLTADINLLCYDPVNYYARSSGILVESLAVGIPVIVPAGCWLSRQFLGRYIEYLEGLRTRTTVLGSKNMTELLRRERENQAAKSKGGILRLHHGPQSSAFFDVPYGATHVLLWGQFAMGTQSAAVTIAEIGWQKEPIRDARRYRLEAVNADGRAALCMELLPNSPGIWVGLGTAHPSEKAWLSALELDFLRAPGGQRFPIGAVGLIYHSTSEVPGLVKELIDHYPHYEHTAAEFSEVWREYHNADRLVRDIETVAGLAGAGGAKSMAASAEGVGV